MAGKNVITPALAFLTACVAFSEGSPVQVQETQIAKTKADSGERWETVETQRFGPIWVDRVTYRSGNLSVVGQICRPVAPGRHPVIVFNHGGAAGLASEWKGGGMCRNLAKKGLVVVQSSYRGEDGSDGKVEVSNGEVDDVIEMVRIVRTKDYVAPDKVVMMGISHGGAITMLAVAKGLRVKAAASLAGPADWGAMYENWQDVIKNGPEHKAVGLRKVTDLMNDVTGGPAARFPKVYQQRSPLHSADKIAKSGIPVMLTTGTDDDTVPPREGCQMMHRIGDLEAYYIDMQGNVLEGPGRNCEDLPIEWNSDPLPEKWDAKRYLLLVRDMEHSVNKKDSARLMAPTLLFLKAHLESD